MTAEPTIALAGLAELAALNGALERAERRTVAQGRMLAHVAATPAISGASASRGSALAVLATAAGLLLLL